jgi:prolyl 3-hydroxylase /prolyl 3,4-dihydroxylase
MAINVYTPGCHLLCHDDVIGSRRVSYILYLTDPDKPWQASWGGALRLYPTDTVDASGNVIKGPSPDFTVSIPPSFNQLSFFAVQPGESFHDVEEVYARGEGEAGEEVDGGRVRMAISGWFHIPQKGEDGFEEGLEEKLAEKSSLMQLQGKADQFEEPKEERTLYEDTVYEPQHDEAEKVQAASKGKGKGKIQLKIEEEIEDIADELTEADLNFLLKYIAPTYLTPDTLDELSENFSDESSVQLSTFLSKKFSASLRQELEDLTSEGTGKPPATDSEPVSPWQIARPPHKHRFLFQYASPGARTAAGPSFLNQVLHDLLPSRPFQKWLQLATGLQLDSHNIIARRFRRGLDYSLATGFTEESARIEVTLGVTPTSGWGDDEDEDGERISDEKERLEVGGYEAYMAGDDEEDEEDDEEGGEASDQVLDKKGNKKAKADPAVYKASGADEDDGLLFSMPAGWNRLSIVMRDQGTLRFVKYVSKAAKGDRYDFTGTFGIVDDGEDDDEEEEEEDDEE